MPYLIEGVGDKMGHYVCIVINFDERKIQYLDNRLDNKARMDKLARVVVSVIWSLCFYCFLFFSVGFV